MAEHRDPSEQQGTPVRRTPRAGGLRLARHSGQPVGDTPANTVGPTPAPGLHSSSKTPGGFDQHSHDVYGWAYRLLGRHHDALDVVQDVFLKWDRQCASGKPRSPRGWLRRVTINLAIDACRRRQAAPSPMDGSTVGAAGGPWVGALGASNGQLEDAMDVVDRETLRDDIVAALETLSDAQRAILVAKVYDDLTFAAIASDLDLAVSTVKTHYVRAIRAVRDRLQPRWAQEAPS